MTSLSYILAELSAPANPSHDAWETRPCKRIGCKDSTHRFRRTDGEQKEFCTTAGISDGLGRWDVAAYYDEESSRWVAYANTDSGADFTGVEGLLALETLTAAMREHVETCARFTGAPLVRRTQAGSPELVEELSFVGAELAGGN